MLILQSWIQQLSIITKWATVKKLKVEVILKILTTIKNMSTNTMPLADLVICTVMYLVLGKTWVPKTDNLTCKWNLTITNTHQEEKNNKKSLTHFKGQEIWITNVINKELHHSLKVKFSKANNYPRAKACAARPHQHGKKRRMAAGCNARWRNRAWGAQQLTVRRPMDSRVRGADSLQISKQHNKIPN
jgi:hypothetical protein